MESNPRGACARRAFRCALCMQQPPSLRACVGACVCICPSIQQPLLPSRSIPTPTPSALCGSKRATGRWVGRRTLSLHGSRVVPPSIHPGVSGHGSFREARRKAPTRSERECNSEVASAISYETFCPSSGRLRVPNCCAGHYCASPSHVIRRFTQHPPSSRASLLAPWMRP